MSSKIKRFRPAQARHEFVRGPTFRRFAAPGQTDRRQQHDELLDVPLVSSSRFSCSADGRFCGRPNRLRLLRFSRVTYDKGLTQTTLFYRQFRGGKR